MTRKVRRMRKCLAGRMTAMSNEQRPSKQKTTDAEYFARLKSRCVVTDRGCWEKQGFRTTSKGMKPGSGYGLMSYRNKNWFAHRLAWHLVNGPIPSGMKVMHKCDNAPCCNPDHLELGTDKENMQDAGKRKRWPRQYRATCINGHPRTPENMVWFGREKKLQCLICHRARQRRRAGWPAHLLEHPGAVPHGERLVGASWKK